MINLAFLTAEKLAAQTISFMRYLTGAKLSVNREITTLMDETAVCVGGALVMKTVYIMSKFSRRDSRQYVLLSCVLRQRLE
ncbi:hypothetical protein Plhal304r1_c027g0090611 [Plasmopara halstedii]